MQIIIDTETTGLTKLSFANRFNYKQWPRMVQIAWAIVEEGSISEREAHLIQPDGFTIPATATQIHGINQERAVEDGIPIIEALQKLKTAFDTCDSIIAHNLSYDLGIIESEALRQEFSVKLPEQRICTMHLGQQYLIRAKGVRRGGYPKLSQLYETLLGFTYSHPHDAGSDVTACFHVYKKLKHLGFL
jgi:DNA polymerase III epsilon subunit-like protein